MVLCCLRIVSCTLPLVRGELISKASFVIFLFFAMWSSSGGGSGPVSDPTDVDPRSINIPGSDKQLVWTQTGPQTIEWVPRGKFLTYGDAIDTKIDFENQHPGYMSRVYKDVNDITAHQPPPAGYHWIQEVASHQSYPWFWNLARDSQWSGDRVSQSSSRDVTDTSRDKWRRRHAGYRRSFFSR